jgi:UDP-N-acetylmuramoyl-tripeptide--D-alanyl-D-alanine ligase
LLKGGGNFMKTLTLHQILSALGLSGMLTTDIVIKRIVRRSQEMKANTLLFHFEDKLEDWKNLYKETAIITSKQTVVEGEVSKKYNVIRVNDMDKVYYQFLNYYRNLFNIPVIGITGTCGKTTTKEMVTHILSSEYHLQSTYLSSNGLFMNLNYLMGIKEDTEAAVIEMGVYYPGNVRTSCHYFQPTVGIITTIGIDHLSGCETLENYIKAKAEMIEGVKKGGTLILNGDNEHIKKINLSSFDGKVITFGRSEECHYRANNIKYGNGGMEFNLWHEGYCFETFVPGYGEHNVYNALAAIAAAHTIKFVDIKTACKRLESFKHIVRHLQIHHGIYNSLIIDDTWTANPTSIEAGLSVLENLALKEARKKIFVLGDVSLLGKYKQEQSIKLAKLIVSQGIDVFITLSEIAHYIADKAFEFGMNQHIYRCESPEEVNEILHHVIDENSIVLLKTSYYEKPDKVIRGLVM